MAETKNYSIYLPVLNKYRSAVALKGVKMGRTNWLKAEINSRKNPPAITIQYPLPHELIMEASQLIKETVNEGVTRYSNFL